MSNEQVKTAKPFLSEYKRRKENLINCIVCRCNCSNLSVSDLLADPDVIQDGYGELWQDCDLLSSRVYD